VSDGVITTSGLAKHYGDVRAVEDLALDVRPGEIYGFLGRNGAGKTTTIRMLLGLIRPTSGEVRLFGRRIEPGVDGVFARVGYLVEAASAYPNLTVRENLDIQRRLTGAPKGAVADSIGLLRLDEYADRRAGTLSLGNKQRLSLARALLHAPDLVVLDEPANALDPSGIVEVRELLKKLAHEHGTTVFMSSHILAEVAHLADRIGIIDRGRLIQELDYDELLRRSREYLDVATSDVVVARSLLSDRLGIGDVEIVDGGLHVFGAVDRAADIASLIVGAGLELSRLAPVHEDLESYFLRLTGDAEGGDQ